MNKDLHKMDEIFNSAYKELSEDPSPGVWDKITSGLDKKDAFSYKRKSKRWKRVAILSLFLLSSFVLYETLEKTNPAHSNKNLPVAINSNKTGETTKQEDKNINQVQSSPVDRSSGSSATVNDNTIHNENILPGNLTSNRITNTNSYQRDMATVPFSRAMDEKESLQANRSSLPENSMAISVENNYADKTAMKQEDYVQTTYLHIVPQSALSTNKSSANNQLFEPNWVISAYASSDRPGYRLDNDGPALSKIKQHEEHQPSFSAGILIARQLKSRLAIQTGLIYSNTTIVISPQQIYASQNQAGKVLYKYVVSSGYAYVKPGFVSAASPGDSLTAEDGQHSLQYVAVPVLLKYNLVKSKKWILSPGFGISGNFLVSAKIETELEGSANREHVSIRRLDGIRQFNWSLMGDVSLEYLVSKRVSLNVRPFFTYAMSPITSNNDVETFPYNLGIGAGASYRF